MDRSRFRHSKPQRPSQKTWADWLGDVSPPAGVRQEIRRAKVAQANTYRSHRPAPKMTAAAQPVPAASPAVKTIEVNLRLPKPKDFKKLGRAHKRIASSARQSRRYAAGWGVAGILAALLLISLVFRGPAAPSKASGSQPAVQPAAAATVLPNLASSAQPVSQTTATQAPSATTASKSTSSSAWDTPSFTPVVPKSEPELAKPTATRTAYNSAANVYTIMDGYLGSPLTINETPLPSGVTLAQAASQIKASQSVALSSGTAYVQPDASSGSQTAILAVRGIVVYVNSAVAHTASQWQAYLNTLQ